MTLNTAIKASIFIFWSKKIFYRCCFLKQRIVEIYKDSLINGKLIQLKDKIAVYFRYSFFGKFNQIENMGNNYSILDDSRAVLWLTKIYKIYKKNLIFYFRTSRFFELSEETKKEFYVSPVRNGSIIIFIAMLSNISFSIILNNPISLCGWFLRGLFIFTGLAGIFCNTGWEEIKKTSFILNKIK